MGRLILAGTLVVVVAVVVAAASGGAQGGGLLPSRCGVAGFTDRTIDINGGYSYRLDWPWVAMLFYTQPRVSRPIRLCNGVLINDRYVLTVANCVSNVIGYKLEFVRLGEDNLDADPDCLGNVCAPPPQDIPVEQIIAHPQYGSPCSNCNDIALLRLARPATLGTPYATPICLPLDPLKDLGFPEEEFVGKTAYATTLNSPSFERQAELRQIPLPIGEGELCSSQLKRGFPDPRMGLCAGGQGKDTCMGDSGMPLMLDNKRGTKVFAVGLTSSGPVRCGADGTQSLYTNVHYYSQWIVDNLRP